MRTHATLNDLKHALGILKPAVNRGSPIPEAPRNHVRVTLDRGGRVHLAAANGELSVRTLVPAPGAPPRAARGFGERAGAWTAIVDYNRLDGFLRRGAHPKTATVDLARTSDGWLRVAVAARSVALRSLDPSQWAPPEPPPLTGLAGEPLLPLRAWWERLVPACASAKAMGFQPVLTGVNLRWRRDTLVAAAIDSYRGHVLTTRARAPRDLEVTIPPAALKAALDAARAPGGTSLSMWTTTARSDGAQVAFRTPRTLVRARVIEGDFPPADQWLPTLADTRAYTTVVRITDADAAADTLRRISRRINAKDTPVTLGFDHGLVTCSVDTPQAAIEGGPLPGVAVEAAADGMGARWGNPRFLADAIAATGDNGTINLHPNARELKVVLRNQSFAAVVMLYRPSAASAAGQAA